MHKQVQVVDISVPANHASLAVHVTPATLHVFSGFFSHPLVWAGFRRLASSQARLAIMSEAPEQPWATGWLKRSRGRWLAARWAWRFAFVLAIGGVGCRFFERIGFPAEKIRPFGYYLDVPSLAPASSVGTSSGVFRFVSAGQLLHRKGIDLLVRACGRLPATGWRLDVYGDGPERSALERLAGRLQLADRIAFHGVIPSDSIPHILATADSAVLPSRFDGWGTFVNEALAVGTPVICTDGCGAADLVTDDQTGHVVPADRTAPLAAALSHALTAGRVQPQIRGAVNERFARCASASWAAAKLISLVGEG